MYNRTVASLFISAFIAVMLIGAAAEDASAIPAFARKYRMSCKTCHYPIPRLKPYGDEFAGNGFRLPDQDAPRYFVDTGDEELSLIRDLPLAIRMDGFVNYSDKGDKRSSYRAPYLIKLLSGGSLSDHLAYYFYFYMNEHGDVAGVEDAFLMYNDAFGIDLDFYLGQFQISDPMFKRELRLTLEDYQIYRMSVGDSEKNLAYDRGMMVTLGLESGTDIIFEVLNGNGLEGADNNRHFDNNKYKDFLGRVSQNLGNYFRLGAFYYTGWERSLGIRNHTWMAGPDFSIAAPGDVFELNFQYVLRKDDDPLFLGPGGDEIETKGVIAEAIIAPAGDESKFFLVGTMNWVDSDIDALDYNSFTGHISFMARRNVRLAFEVTREFEQKWTRLGVGFVSGF